MIVIVICIILVKKQTKLSEIELFCLIPFKIEIIFSILDWHVIIVMRMGSPYENRDMYCFS